MTKAAVPAVQRPLPWWERVDSNHRSRRQQIYSLPPLATRERSQIDPAKRSPNMELFAVAGGWSW